MAQFSERARRLMAGAHWHDEPRARREVTAWLHSVGLAAAEALLAFQEELGGLEYRVNGRPEGWRFGLIGNQVESLIEGLYARALDHRCAPLPFGLHHRSGEICVRDAHGWLPVASCARLLVESDAIVDEIAGIWPGGVFASLGCLPTEDSRLEPALFSMRTGWHREDVAGDRYRTWWMQEKLRVFRGPFYDSRKPRDLVEVYAVDLAAVRQLAADLVESGVLARDAVLRCYPHPFEPRALYYGPP